MKEVTKDVIIKEFKHLLNEYLLDTGSNRITRDYYRENSKYGTLFQKFFTFNELKQTYSVDLPEKKINKKVVVISSILPKTDIEHDFVSAMEHYCKVNNGQLLLVPIRGVRK